MISGLNSTRYPLTHYKNTQIPEMVVGNSDNGMWGITQAAAQTAITTAKSKQQRKRQAAAQMVGSSANGNEQCKRQAEVQMASSSVKSKR